MPFRNDPLKFPNRAYVQFLSCAKMPSLLRKAAKVRGLPSNAAYLNQVVAEAVAKDLGLDEAALKAELPRTKDDVVPFQPADEAGKAG